MEQNRWERIVTLFTSAVALPPYERGPFLTEQAKDDADLVRQVEALLEHDVLAGEEFLQLPQGDTRIDEILAVIAPDSRVGKSVGSYQIKRVLTKDASGATYLAENPALNQPIALRVVDHRLISSSAARRLSDESESLTRLRSPNIASIYEAEIWRSKDPQEGALPYFVMEYIADAVPVTVYADQRKLGIRARLALFREVCQAVSHGHQRGIIHRDLRPSSIVVSPSGQVKILGFGVTWATDLDVALAESKTESGPLTGSFQYMSPEQCAGDIQAIDARSDVYSLGVVLYELLCDRPPYDVSRAPATHAARIILEQAPRPLSAVNRAVHADLEMIVLRALEKDRERRYPSVEAFSADIRRFLTQYPIEARRPSAHYLFSMFVRRHPALVGLAALLFIALGVETAVSTWLLMDARRSARRATGIEQESTGRAEAAERQAYLATMRGVEAAIAGRDAATASELLSDYDENGRAWERAHFLTRVDQSVGTLLPIGHANQRQLPGRKRLDFRAMDVSTSGLIVVVASSSPGRGPWQLYLCPADSAQAQFPPPLDVEGEVTAVTISSDGEYIAAVADGEITLFGAGQSQGPRQLRRWRNEGQKVTCLAFQPGNQRILASGSHDGTITIWGFEFLNQPLLQPLPKQLATVRAQDGEVVALTFDPAGRILASTSTDRLIRLWDADLLLQGQKASESTVLSGHSGAVQAIDFSPDGRLLASASTDSTVRLWSVADIRRHSSKRQDVGSSFGSGGVLLATFTGHRDAAHGVAFDPAGTRVVSAGDDGLIHIWDVSGYAHNVHRQRDHDWQGPARAASASLMGHRGIVRAINCLPEGRIISASEDGTVRIWAASTPDVWDICEPVCDVRSLAFDKSGRIIALGGPDGISIWDANRCIPLARRMLRRGVTVEHVAFMDRAKKLVVASRCVLPWKSPGALAIWDVSDPRRPRPEGEFPHEGEHEGFLSLTLCPDESRVAAGAVDGTILVWDVSKLPDVGLPLVLRGNRAPVKDLVFLDESGKRLASADGSLEGSQAPEGDSAIRVWDVESGSLVTEVKHPRASAINSLAWRADKRLLAAAGADGRVLLWSAEQAAPTMGLHPQFFLKNSQEPVTRVIFHPTQDRLFAASGDGAVRVWDLESRDVVATLCRAPGTVADMAFDRRRERLASAGHAVFSTGTTVCLWETRSPFALRQRRSDFRRLQDDIEDALDGRPMATTDLHRRLGRDRPPHVLALIDEHLDSLLPHPKRILMATYPIGCDATAGPSAWEPALEWIKLAIREAPQDGRFWITKATLEYRLKRYDDALQAIQEAKLSCQGESTLSRLALLAMIQSQLGNITEAKATLQELRQALGAEKPTSVAPDGEKAVDAHTLHLVGEAERTAGAG